QGPARRSRTRAQPPVAPPEGRDDPSFVGFDALRIRYRRRAARRGAPAGRLHAHPSGNGPSHDRADRLRRARSEHPRARRRGPPRGPLRPDRMNQPRPARAIAVVAPLALDAGALVWPALCACAALAAVFPLWVGRFLPYQDAPQHLAAIRVLADYHAPGFAFEKWFEIDLLRSQYVGFYLPAALLSRVCGPEVACRLVLSAIALALPAATWMFLRSFGRDVRLAVFAPALFHTAPLYLGFFNFVESIPATIFVIALVERELHAPVRARAALLAVAAVVLLYLHPSALALALGAA